MNYLTQFKVHIENQDYAKFLSLWEEYCMGDEIDEEEFKEILECVKDSEMAIPFGKHVEQSLILYENLEPSNTTDEIFRLITDLQTSNSHEITEKIFSYLKEKFGNKPYFEEKMKLAGLQDRHAYQGAISRVELLNHLKEGNFVFHTGGWGVGEIMDVSLIREQLTLEFDYVSGKKDFSLKNAFKMLIPVSSDHFLARRFGDPDKLESDAKKDPLSIIHLMLKNLGPLSAADFKEELFGLVIPEDDWLKWWQTARSKMKKDTMIESPSSIKKPFSLRRNKFTHEQRLRADLEKLEGANDLIQLLYSYTRDFAPTLKNEDFKKEIIEKLKDSLSTIELTDAQALQLHFFLQDLMQEKQYAPVSDLIEKLPSLEDLVKEIDIIPFKKRVLVETRKRRKDWQQVFINLFLRTEQNTLRDYILTQLLTSGKEKEIEEKLFDLLSTPIRAPGILLWYFQKIMKEEKVPLSNQNGKDRFFEATLIVLSQIEGATGFRDMVKKILTFITKGRYSNVRNIFKKSNYDMVHEFLLLATKCQSLTEHDIKIFHSLAELVHPSLKNLQSKYQEPEVEVPVIWTTEKGYQKIKERIHTIGTIETVENAKEIEVARAHGDLRENAEFKAALEKRDRLQGELKLLSDMFNIARIITPEDIKSDVIGIGNRVLFKNEKGDSTEYSILGPWDADPETNILSFQSQLAKSMLGKKKGDKVTIQSDEYTVESITSALK